MRWIIGITVAIALLFGIFLLLRWGIVQNSGLGETAAALEMIEFPSWFNTLETVFGVGTIFSIFLLVFALYISNKARGSRGGY